MLDIELRGKGSFHLRALPFFWIVFCSACGGSGGAIPDLPDATQPDANQIDAPPACACPGADTLVEERLERDVVELRNTGGLGGGCVDRTKIMVGAGCFVNSVSTSIGLRNAGFIQYRGGQNDDGWQCSWSNSSSTVHTWTNTLICMEPAKLTVPSLPAECSCPPVEPFEDRFLLSARAGSLPPGQITVVESMCEEGELHVGGGCTLTFRTDAADFSGRLIMGGFDDDTGGWKCIWENVSSQTLIGTSASACVRDPLPGMATEEVPLSERVVRVERSANLSGGSILQVSATCAPGDFLFWGSCTLEEEPGSSLRGVKLFNSGFLSPAQNRPNTWECAWSVPVDVTTSARATATGVCLKPLPTR